MRLSHVLTRHARATLTRVLLAHVAGAAMAAGLRTVVVAAGAVDPPQGADVWPERAPGLNGALRAALREVDGHVLIVPADLPWLTSDAIRDLLAEEGDVVVVPSRDLGTNGLLLRERIEPAFGPGSALVHAALGRAKGLRTRVVAIEAFADDVDDEPALRRAFAGSPAIPAGIAAELSGNDAGGRSRGPQHHLMR